MDQRHAHYATLKNEDVVSELTSSFENGLEKKEADKRLKAFGFNELGSGQVHAWDIFMNQIRSPFVYILILAAILSLFFGHTLDAGMIVLFIVINTFLGFWQEYKSEKTLRLLKQYLRLNAKVIRDGKQIIIPSRELVVGDLVILETGDMISADIRLLEDKDVEVDESVLTGESIAIHKNGAPIAEHPKTIYELNNTVFTGTNVLEGSVKGIVIATGKDTEFGQIKKLTTETLKESAFAKGISRFSSFILKLTVITLCLVYLANILIKGKEAHLAELLIFSIALAVSVIPEALPLVTTLSLSKGALKLAQKKVITKRLSAIEDLGSVEILCSDKTGTITENKLKVTEFFPKENKFNLVLHANLVGSYFHQSLDPFDVALKNEFLGKSFKAEKKNVSKFEQVSFSAFDPKKRRNSVLVKDAKGAKTLVVRGAPEELIKLSVNLDTHEKEIFKNWIVEQGTNGYRTLAVASRKIAKSSEDLSTLEKDLTFEGCISFEDPIKESTIPAIQKAESLGIGVKIITGDSKEVALSIAQRVGLLKENKKVFLASDFMSLSEDEQKRLLPDIVVFARSDPSQKHTLVHMMQQHNEVGFLGEGINDSPALKAAGVSIVVQSASDIARESADIILLEKDLSVIVDGIEEGRKIFTNTVKYLKATLASNFGNFYAVALGSLFINFLPMLPIQILLVNLLSDFPMVAIATDKVDASELQKPKQYNVKDIVIIATVLGVVSTVFDFMFFALFFKMEPAILQTNWFIGSILTELVFLFSVRTQLPFWKASFPSRTVLLLTGSAFITTIILPFTRFGQEIFHFIRPSASHMALILFLVAAYFICSETIKNVYYRLLGAKNGNR